MFRLINPLLLLAKVAVVAMVCSPLNLVAQNYNNRSYSNEPYRARTQTQAPRPLSLRDYCHAADQIAKENGFEEFWLSRADKLCSGRGPSAVIRSKGEIHKLITQVLLNGVRSFTAPDQSQTKESGNSGSTNISASVRTKDQLLRIWRRFEPEHKDYQIIKLMLKDFAAYDFRYIDPKVLSKLPRTLKEGNCHPGVRALNEYFYVPDKYIREDCFSTMLALKIYRFQEAHNITANGIYGPPERALLAITKRDFEKRLKVNLERWRWLPQRFSDKYVLVNIGDYEMVYGEQRQTNKMKIVVGETYTPTQSFNDEIEYLVVNPWWNVPHTISRGETLEEAKAEPGYLARNSFVAYRGNKIVSQAEYIRNSGTNLRQKPGKDNALGNLKFMFPNKYSIYIHDTPEKMAFAHTRRAFSHGCIRIEDPPEFARWLLAGSEKSMSKQAVQQTIDTGKTKTIFLKKKVPVYIGSWSVVTGPGNTVRAVPDLYGADREVAKILRIRG